MLASISTKASGSVDMAFRAGGTTTRFSAPINAAKGEVRVSRAIPKPQARKGSGTLTLTYRGDGDTRAYSVRLLAAGRAPSLKAQRPRIAGGRLQAAGKVAKLARGSVAVQLRMTLPGRSRPRSLTFKARIVKGRYRLDKRLSTDVMRVTTTATLSSYVTYAGDKRGAISGQSSFFEVVALR